MHLIESLAALAAFAGLSAAIPTATHGGHGHGFNWDDVKYLLAFGDSYSYVQGSAGRQNYSFIGDQLNYSFDAETLLENKIWQNATSTAEGGPNWLEYITGCGLKPGLTSPLSCKKQLWDFAFAGADISTDYTPLHHDYTISLENQITQYLTYAHSTLTQNLSHYPSPSNTLVAIWIGTNDINDSARYNVSFPSFYDLLQTRLIDRLAPLIDLDFTNFLFMNLAPLDRTASNQASSKPLPNATMVRWWNEGLASHAAAFEKANADRGVRALAFDVNGVLNKVMDEPEQYGITNTTGWCAGYNQADVETEWKKYGCSGPLETYFWFNSGHLTWRVHEILAGKLLKALKNWKA